MPSRSTTVAVGAPIPVGSGGRVLSVSHDPGAAAHADRLLTLRDGRIVNDASPGSTEDVIELQKRLD